LITELGSSLNSTSDELHGKIEGVSSKFNKLNEDLTGNINVDNFICFG